MTNVTMPKHLQTPKHNDKGSPHLGWSQEEHVAQASQAKHGSLVDRGANGGLAGSDVRVLSRSSRKCTVTGIDSHELQGLDVVQCAALVATNHGIVNWITNELAMARDTPSIPLDKLSGSKTQ